MNNMSSFWALFIVVDIIILWFFFRALYRRNRGNRKTRRRNAFFLSSPSPSSLEQGRHKEIVELMQLLERSIPASYAHSVRQRVIKAHPHLTEQEYDWRWNELKRYFMLCAIMNRVPMFSPDVDELWHEMLMFTREYQQFSEAFFGRMLHHAPHSSSQPMPDERAWFDWLYMECFGWNRYSASLWGAFFNHPLPNNELAHYYKLATSGQPAGDRWNTQEGMGISQQAQQAVQRIVDHLRILVNEAVDDPDGKRLPKVNYLQSEYLLLAVVWYSWYQPQQFALHMHPDTTGSAALASSSGCSSASGCSNWDTHHSHHHSSHGSSHDGGSSHHDSGDSGSSHSSCSSSFSCGSSCGGGGGD
ncbi:hypothetical protein [Paenibacillus sp. 8b26]|uniref:hypothetical protein n=1 Tax=Paenibacillus sp. 8b26 TaxID=3424133 RepID=UPI003D661861